MTLLRGVEFVYLAPYSPDLNPIEEGFSALKAWIHRHNADVREAFEQQDDDEAAVMLMMATASVMTADNTAGWFSHSGYI